jgi:hypothetical protein
MDTVLLYFLALGGILAGLIAILWLVRVDSRLKQLEEPRVK